MGAVSTMKKILIIEDDRELNLGVSYALEKEQYQVLKAFSLREGKKLETEQNLDLILLDVNLPDGEGFSFLTSPR